MYLWAHLQAPLVYEGSDLTTEVIVNGSEIPWYHWWKIRGIAFGGRESLEMWPWGYSLPSVLPLLPGSHDVNSYHGFLDMTVWLFWKHDPRQILPHLGCLCQVFYPRDMQTANTQAWKTLPSTDSKTKSVSMCFYINRVNIFWGSFELDKT